MLVEHCLMRTIQHPPQMLELLRDPQAVPLLGSGWFWKGTDLIGTSIQDPDPTDPMTKNPLAV